MKFYVTTPIYYVNDRPHIGHAYSTLAADILARFHRFIGDDTFFLTGTDEHGIKIAEAARKAEQEPQAFADEVAEQFKHTWDALDISYDRFIRTTEADHIQTVTLFLQKLYERQFIYQGTYTGLYCRGHEAFMKPTELVDGKCPDHGTVPEELSEPTYFFKLSAFRAPLIKLIASDELRILPQTRKHEVLAFLEGQELEDIAISRQNVAWGIPLPWDEQFTIYVWVDALINYYTARGAFWPPDWHVIGKDILRFHCVIWPAMLLAAEEALPRGIFVHGFFTVDGQKMSKTLGNGVDPLQIVKEYSPDALRYFLFRSFPFGSDGDFSYSLLDEVYNGALSNELGNVVQRVVVMVEKYRAGTVSQVASRISNIETAMVHDAWAKWEEALQNLQIDAAYRAVWDLMRFANQRIDDTKPWDLAKNNEPEALDEILYELLEILRHITLMITPLLPSTAQKIGALLGIAVAERQTTLEFEKIKQWGGLVPGTHVTVGQVLFPRRG